MKNIDIKRIIKEEIAKMYEETNLLSNFLGLKEAALKFNRLVENDIEGVEKVYNKLDKYSVSSVEKIEKDLDVIESFMIELESVKSVVQGVINDNELTDSEEIELKSISDKVYKLYYLVEGIKVYLKKIESAFSNIKGYMDDISTKAIKLDDKSGLKIFIN